MLANINKKLNESLTARDFRNHILTQARRVRTLKVVHSESLVIIRSSSTSYHAGIDYTMQINADTKSLSIVAEKKEGLPKFVVNLLADRGYSESDYRCEYRGEVNTPEEFDALLDNFNHIVDLILGRAEVVTIEDDTLVVLDASTFNNCIEEIRKYAVTTATPVQDIIVSSSIRNELSPTASEIIDQFDAYLGGTLQLDSTAKSGFMVLLDHLDEIPTEEIAEEVVEEPTETVVMSDVEYTDPDNLVSKLTNVLHVTSSSKYDYLASEGVNAYGHEEVFILRRELGSTKYEVIFVVSDEATAVDRINKYIEIDNRDLQSTEDTEFKQDSLDTFRKYAKLNQFSITLDDEDVVLATKVMNELTNANAKESIKAYFYKKLDKIMVTYSASNPEFKSLIPKGFEKIAGFYELEVDIADRTDVISTFGTIEQLIKDLEEHDVKVGTYLGSTEVSAFKSLCSNLMFYVIKETPSKIVASSLFTVDTPSQDDDKIEFTMTLTKESTELRIASSDLTLDDEVAGLISSVSQIEKDDEEFYYITGSDIDSMKLAFRKCDEVTDVVKSGLSDITSELDNFEFDLEDEGITEDDLVRELSSHTCNFDDVDRDDGDVIATKYLDNLKSVVTASTDGSLQLVLEISKEVDKASFDDILPDEYYIRSYGGLILTDFEDLTNLDDIVSKHQTTANIVDMSIAKLLSKEPTKSTSDIHDEARMAEVEAKINLVKDPDQKEQLKRLVKYVRQVAPWINENNDYNTFFLEEPKEFKKYKIPTVAIAVTCYLMDKSEWPGGEWDPGQVYKKFIKAKRVVRLRRWFKTTDPDGNKCWMAIFVDAQYAREHGRDLLEESLNKVVRHNGEDFIVENFKNGKAILMNESRSVMVDEFDVLFK